MNVASQELCQELFDLTGWETGSTGFCYYAQTLAFGTMLGSIPAYTLGFLVDKALETGHVHVKIKLGKKGIIVTSPPMYHIEAATPEDAVAKLLIRSATRGFKFTKIKTAAAKNV